MATEHDEHEDDGGMGRRLRERLPRHRAPAGLRTAVAESLQPAPSRRPWWMAWVAPACASLATALAMLLWIAPSLPHAPSIDSAQLVERAVLAEHARNIFWGRSRPDVVLVALPRAMEESGVSLNWIFTGDDDLRLTDAKPTYLEGRRGIELTYQDVAGHTMTYVIVPGGTVTLPERGRVQIDRWRPVVKKENGFSLIIWRQQGLLCVMASDLVSEQDLARFKQYFVKIRSSSEPYVVY